MIILAFKISILNFTPLKMVTSIYIYCKQCILTKFTTKKLLLFEFQVWASVAAFLAFSTLKFQTNAKTNLKPSSKHIYGKKKKNFLCVWLLIWSLIWDFGPSYPFSIFLWSLKSKKLTIIQQQQPFYRLIELLFKISHFQSLCSLKDFQYLLKLRFPSQSS